jgi:putative phage-type endonuclease
MSASTIEQNSPEWHAARCGRVTASRIADMLAKTESGWGASRANYKAQLVAERLTGSVADRYTNAAMQWGTDMEPEAVAAYAFYHGADPAPVGFVPHPTIAMAGASPDRLIGDDGLIEVKCPNTATHIETLLEGAVPGKYRLQMMWQMACTGRQWCDFVSFDLRMPEDMRLFVRRIERCPVTIADIEKEVRIFLAEIDDTVNRLVAAYRPAAQAAE